MEGNSSDNLLFSFTVETMPAGNRNTNAATPEMARNNDPFDLVAQQVREPRGQICPLPAKPVSLQVEQFGDPFECPVTGRLSAGTNVGKLIDFGESPVLDKENKNDLNTQVSSRCRFEGDFSPICCRHDQAQPQLLSHRIVNHMVRRRICSK